MVHCDIVFCRVRPVVSPKRAGKAGNKESISVTMDPELLAWVRQRSGAGMQFSSVSHALERGIRALMELEK